MDRNKLHAPKRDFKIRGRGNFEVMSREDMKRHKIQDIIPSTKAKPVVEKPQTAAPVNNSRGVYIDAVKAPTLSSNTKVTIAPPKIDEVALEKTKMKLEESLNDITEASYESLPNTELSKKVEPPKQVESTKIEEPKGLNSTTPPKELKKDKKTKKKFLFW